MVFGCLIDSKLQHGCRDVTIQKELAKIRPRKNFYSIFFHKMALPAPVQVAPLIKVKIRNLCLISK